jgi:prepilin-type processing-associated H-X9-DG protein
MCQSFFLSNRTERDAYRPFKLRGATLTEVLVAIVIAILLLSLVLGAVVQARASSHTVVCKSRLAAIGQALSNYVAAHVHYPLTYTSDGAPTGPIQTSGNFSPQARLLSFLGETQLADSLNWNRPFLGMPGDGAKAHETVMRAVVSVFLCPADSEAIFRKNGGCNTRMNLGSSVETTSEKKRGLLGPFGGIWDRVRTASIADGLAHTAAASERLRGDSDNGRLANDRDFWYTDVEYAWNGSEMAVPAPDSMWQECDRLPATVPRHHSTSGMTWIASGVRDTLYNHVATPNHAIPDCSIGPYGAVILIPRGAPGVYSARSAHSGGVNVLTLDGAVRFVNNSVSKEAWRALGSRAAEDLASGL